jgi:hypothetical protein
MSEKKFTIVLRRAPDYKIYPVGVIFGGPTPDGQSILANICVDHAAFPNYIQHPVSDEGRVDPSKIDDMAVVGDVERELLCGISLSVDQARKTIAWLSDMVQKIERQGGQQHG